MASTSRRLKQVKPERWYRGVDIPMRVTRRFARAVVEQFHPDKIILFGSYAYGTPHEDSDVDILVVMPARNQLDMAFKIHWAIQPPFPLDIIVRTPHSMKWRLAEGESFLTEVVSRGKVLYEKDNTGVGAQRRGRPRSRKAGHASPMKWTTSEWVSKAEAGYSGAKSLARNNGPSLHDLVCFHCQETAEKYLKALLEELGIAGAKTHELKKLLTALQPHHPGLNPLKRGLTFLTRFAVETLYPGEYATKRQAEAALRWAKKTRTAARALLGLR